jgi:hypothetical protein
MRLGIIWLSVLGLALSQWANGQTTAANQGVAQTPVPKSGRAHVSLRRHTASPALPNNVARGNGPNANRTNVNRAAYADALRRYRHERHNRQWWKQHYTTIVLVGGGYYFWDAGYWCPAWGYDPLYDNYDYDGPIYTYGNLLPDQVIVNVQRALQQEGYYNGGLTGSLGPASRQALAAYQEDAGLVVTGAIDAPTVEALGLQ